MAYALAEQDLSRPVAEPTKTASVADKALLRFITCGSVDDGKSTLIGRMLYDSRMIADDQLEALDRDSKKFGTQGGALDFALLVDGLAAEREQGITIDVAYRYFKTDRRSFIVADTPGHEQYTRNMATGASTADLAIILIDARKGILPQTRRHSFIVSMLGVRDVALAINKMDLVDYSEARFNEIVAAYREMARDLNFRSIAPLPISALARRQHRLAVRAHALVPGRAAADLSRKCRDRRRGAERGGVPLPGAMGQPPEPRFPRLFRLGRQRRGRGWATKSPRSRRGAPAASSAS